jgi:hypothetical protein
VLNHRGHVRFQAHQPFDQARLAAIVESEGQVKAHVAE